MIAYLKGKIKFKYSGFLVVETGGVGYKVFIPLSVLEESKEDEEIELFVSQYVREDRLDLFGFKSLEEMEFFEQLQGVSMVGPKSALSLLGVAKLDEIKKAIIHGDPEILTKVSGVGKKTSERIVLELKNKIGVDGENHEEAGGLPVGDSEVIDGLVGRDCI